MNRFIHQRMAKNQRVPASAPANMRMMAPARAGAFHQIMPAVQNTAKKIEANQPFTSTEDLAYRCKLRDDQMSKLAYAGALGSLGLSRRNALWQAAKAARPAGELLECGGHAAAMGGSPLPEMSPVEETMADYHAMELTTGKHLVEHYRSNLKKDNVLSAADLMRLPTGRRVTTAGAVIVRQRPGTAKGFVFLTLEDETGLSQAIVSPQLFSEQRSTILGHSGLIVEGILQNQDGQCSVRADKFWTLDGIDDIVSHDFH